VARDVQPEFELHPRLAADCLVIGELPVSRLLLMNDRRYPWCILVPRIPGASALHTLDEPAGAGLWEEIRRVSAALIETTGCRKLNVGALGNVVDQLHVHVVGRNAGDAAWPGPVWGFGAAEPYAPEAAAALRERLRAALGLGP
jgi:diadenosine tetraphosphate (Ap4A) HIT family hydrolase